MRPIFILLLFISTFAAEHLQAQETRFFVPKEIARAYENGTRSYDGKPGPKYWQNTADYTINVSVEPEERTLEGTETVTYYNNSPNTLNQLIIRLYHDVFRKANPRAYRVRPDDINEGVTISKLTVNGEVYDVSRRQEVSRSGTNMRVALKEPLKSGEKIELEISWSQQIPETTIREGAYDSTSFFVAYWYPQIAAYDDLFGWDRLSYDFSTEFYNELANYDVTINVPNSFTVLATGELQNPDKVLKKKQLDRYREAQKSTSSVVIVTPDEATPDFSHQSGSWHYKASEVTDFSFCMSDHYSWDAAIQQLADRSVLVHSFYPASKASACENLTSNQQKMMKHFSEDMPAVPYPYPEFTTFMSGAGGGGMETPMMANNGNPGLGVTVHEMFHTYFPMYVRVNEKRYAWMDEGWADFNTTYVTKRHFSDEGESLFAGIASSMQGVFGGQSDLPLITSTQFMDQSNYGYASYTLPSFVYTMLHHHLGDELFKKCYKTYIQRWAKKSPSPYDFFYTFEDVSGQDLSWFWKPWFFNYGNADVSIESFKKGKLRIKNNGTRPVPVFITVRYKDGKGESEQSLSAASWKKGSTQTIRIPRAREIKSLTVNTNMPDANILDNLFPPLRESYKGVTIPECMYGKYQIKQFQVGMEISEKDGLLFMEIPAGNLEQYLLPTGATSFESIDGSIKIELKKEGDQCNGLTLDTQFVEFPLDAEKK